MGEHTRSSWERLSPWENQSEIMLLSCVETALGAAARGRRWVGAEGPEGCILHGHALGDEQLLLAGVRLHVEVAVVDEQHVQEVLGELGSPGDVQPYPQQLWGERGRAVRAFGFAGGGLGERFLASPWQNCYF